MARRRSYIGGHTVLTQSRADFEATLARDALRIKRKALQQYIAPDPYGTDRQTKTDDHATTVKQYKRIKFREHDRRMRWYQQQAGRRNVQGCSQDVKVRRPKP